MEKHSLTTPFLFNRMGLPPQPTQSRGHKRLGGLTFAAIALATQAVSAADLTAWNYNPTTQQLEVTAKAGIQPKYFVMAQPARIVLDLPDTEMGAVQPKASFTQGVIRQVRVSQFQPGVTRVVLELAPNVELAPGQVKLEAKGDRWILRPLIAGQSATATKPTPQPTTAIATQPTLGEPTPPPLATPPAPVPLAMGADISPVTSEPPIPSQVAVPPLVPPPAPLAVPPLATPSAPVAVPPLAPAPPAVNSLPPAIASNLPSVTPLPAVAQVPLEATTPLPPETELPSSRLMGEENNSITISVPPPVALPPAAPPVGLPPAPAPQPLPVVDNVTNLPQPAPARALQTPPAAIAVPSLPPAPPIALPSVTPLPPTTVPPLAPITAPPSPYPTVTPTAGSITTKMGGQPTGTIQIQPQPTVAIPVPTAPTTPPVKRQPPASWVMQPGAMPPATLPAASVSPEPINVPSAAIAPAPIPSPVAPPRPPGQVVTAPNSWVMQSSGLTQPSLVQPLPRPPVSSVIQPSVPQPIAAMPMPTASGPQPSPLPAAPQMGTTPTVSVPPLPTGTLPPVSVPALQPAPLPAAPMPVNPNGVVEFGQPLPTQGAASLTPTPVGLPTTIAANSPMSHSPISNSSVGTGQIIAPRQTGVAQSINPAIALPAGTVLALSYPGVTELPLDATNPRQEMLVLQTEVRDASGNIVFPRGSYVMGRFEPGRTGTKFTTSAIQRGDRIVPFVGESDAIGGSREISPTSMAIYSGAGALAGGLVSGFSGWGLLLGGAAGAATNYLTTPKPGGTVQPGQVIPIRMLQDIPF